MEKILLHSNSTGVDMFRIDAKKRSKVCVGYHKNGEHYTIRTYRMNNVHFYEHQYLSWANLDCCGGWSFDEEYLYTAVQKDKKLIAQIAFETEGPEKDLERATLKFKELIPSIDESKINVIIEAGHTDYYKNRIWHAILIRKGCLGDYFDLFEIANVYAAQDFIFNDEIERKLSDAFKTELSELYTERNYYFYNPVTFVDCIITGLCFGYPIESTIDFMLR